MFQGLSLDQAPPFPAPLRFFLSAPLFAVMAAMVVFFGDSSFVNIYSPKMIATLHLFTLGFMSMVMIGAMQQMLPVLVGVTFPKPLLFAKIIHTALVIGTLLLSAGLYFGIDSFLLVSSLFLVISIGLFIAVTVYKIFLSKYSNETIFSMRFSLVSFLIALIGAVYMLLSLGLSKVGENIFYVIKFHALWAVFGWSGLLIIGVAFQVVPMFYVTPDYNKRLKKYLPTVIFLSLIIVSIEIFFDIKATFILLSLFYALFGFFTLYLMEKRKRKLVDTTINYWRFSSLMLITGSVLFIVYTFFPNDTFLWITGVIFGYGFIISLINGMLYKIVPFLTWFHVSSKGFFDIPTMREMIPDKNAKIQLYFHIASVIVLTLLPFFDLLKIAAFLIAVSNILLFLNMLKASRLFFKYEV